MQEHFNNASLANLSESELKTLLANYLAKLSAAKSEADKAQIRADIAVIKMQLCHPY